MYITLSTISIYLPSNVRGWSVTQPVCTYSTNNRNTSASNSSITIIVGDVMLAEALLIAVAAVPAALPRLYFDHDVGALVPADAILLLFLILFLFGGDFCCCYIYVHPQQHIIHKLYEKIIYTLHRVIKWLENESVGGEDVII